MDAALRDMLHRPAEWVLRKKPAVNAQVKELERSEGVTMPGSLKIFRSIY